MLDARLLVSRIEDLDDGIFQQLVLWRVPSPVKGSEHTYKYRFALVAGGVCVLRYDNEAGKGDHKHIGGREMPYRFAGVRTPFRDFDADVARWIDENRSH